mmetsp:Transcript_6013/g.6905  ORF Transcript_6013/g.6905 Transcript_6013/m.6905 type:complete len:375 (+) Transcript_6013:257-1381(+)
MGNAVERQSRRWSKSVRYRYSQLIHRSLPLVLEEEDKEVEQNLLPDIVLLGGTGSGKSVLLRQLRNLTGDTERKYGYQTTGSYVASAVIFTVEVMEKSKGRLDPNLVQKVSPLVGDYRPLGAFYMPQSFSAHRCKEIAYGLKLLWEDEGFNLEYRKTFYFSYDLKGMAAIAVDCLNKYDFTWRPDLDLYHGARTTGIYPHVINFGNGLELSVIDIGGARSEQRKWPKMLRTIKSCRPVVVYLAPLSDYNDTCFENHQQNRLVSSLDTFSRVLKMCSKEKISPDIVILFNKFGVFKEKLRNMCIPFNESGLFPNAPKTFDPEEAVDWVRQEFLRRVTDDSLRVQTHVIDGFDISEIEECVNTILYPMENESYDYH